MSESLVAQEAKHDTETLGSRGKDSVRRDIAIRDFAYPTEHDLHRGPRQSYLSKWQSDQAVEQEESEELDKSTKGDGPPYEEDEDLQSPVCAIHAKGAATSDPRNAAVEYSFHATSPEEIHGPALALYDFEPEHENETALKEGQIVWITYRHGQGWLVAQDPETGESGLVPEDYCQMLNHDDTHPIADVSESPTKTTLSHDSEDEWVDETGDEAEHMSPAKIPTSLTL